MSERKYYGFATLCLKLYPRRLLVVSLIIRFSKLVRMLGTLYVGATLIVVLSPCDYFISEISRWFLLILGIGILSSICMVEFPGDLTKRGTYMTFKYNLLFFFLSLYLCLLIRCTCIGYCCPWSYSLTHTHTHTHTRSAGLPWTMDRLFAETFTW